MVLSSYTYLSFHSHAPDFESFSTTPKKQTETGLRQSNCCVIQYLLIPLFRSTLGRLVNGR